MGGRKYNISMDYRAFRRANLGLPLWNQGLKSLKLAEPLSSLTNGKCYLLKGTGY